MKTTARALALLACAAAIAGCAQGPRAVPGGATEAAVFFTPQVREARRAAGDVYPSQHAEYARRDALVGARRSSSPYYRTDPASGSYTRLEQTRISVTSGGIRVYEPVAGSVR